MNVNELLEQLAKMPGDLEVKVWLPGSTISLSSAFVQTASKLPTMRSEGKVVLIEGNIDAGSALDA